MDKDIIKILEDWRETIEYEGDPYATCAKPKPTKQIAKEIMGTVERFIFGGKLDNILTAHEGERLLYFREGWDDGGTERRFYPVYGKEEQ